LTWLAPLITGSGGAIGSGAGRGDGLGIGLVTITVPFSVQPCLREHRLALAGMRSDAAGNWRRFALHSEC